MPVLLDFFKSTANQSLQVLALREYLKLLALPSQGPDAESARLLGKRGQTHFPAKFGKCVCPLFLDHGDS
jgi:hypothetical protein